jgi:SSS family solute:Na+ symporter
MLQLGVLLVGGMALSIATIRAVGGWGTVVQSMETWDLILPASDPAFPWTMYLGASLCVSTFYFAANQFIVQRALAAKDEWHARMGIVFTDYLKFLLPLIIIVPGLMAPKLYPNLQRADLVFPTLVENLLPSGLVGLVMAGLIAAVMGHTSGAINSCTTIATIDFYLPWKKWRLAKDQQREGFPVAAPTPAAVPVGAAVGGAGGGAGDAAGTPPPVRPELPEKVVPAEEATDAQAIAFGRWFAVLIIIVGVLCAELLTTHSQRPIFLYLLDAYGLFTPGIATMFLLGILWRRTTTAGALTAGIMTIPLSIALQFAVPSLSFMNRTGIVFWACMATCAIVSLCTKPPPESSLTGLIWTRDSLRLPAHERHKYRGLRRPVVWWALITVVVLYFYIRYA